MRVYLAQIRVHDDAGKEINLVVNGDRILTRYELLEDSQNYWLHKVIGEFEKLGFKYHEGAAITCNEGKLVRGNLTLVVYKTCKQFILEEDD